MQKTSKTEALKFGDPIMMIAASEGNPLKDCFFVRSGNRTGRMNAGPYIEATDMKGKFWTTPVDNIARREVPASPDTGEAVAWPKRERETDFHVHELKTWPDAFDAMHDGRKLFEFRKHDRDYRVGDHILSCRFDPDIPDYTGECDRFEITFMLVAGQYGVPNGYAVLGVKAHDDDLFTHPVTPEGGERIKQLEGALRQARDAIVKAALDTLWCESVPSETVVDRIDAALGGEVETAELFPQPDLSASGGAQGLEWREDLLFFNGHDIGGASLTEYHYQFELMGEWDQTLYTTLDAAKAAAVYAARVWLSPLSQASDTVAVRKAAADVIKLTDEYNERLSLYRKAPHLVPEPDSSAALAAFDRLRASMGGK